MEPNEPDAAPPPAMNPSLRLLVVDDDRVFREELSSLLRDDGHSVQEAPSVAKAIQELELEEFDVVFTDMKMPRKSGLDLVREVHQRWPRTMLVMITGFATVDTAVEAMKLGAFDYISKPFQMRQVQQVLDVLRQEIRFQIGGDRLTDEDALARSWVSSTDRDVLHLTSRTTHPRPRITVHAPDYTDPSRIRDVVDAFVKLYPRPALILEGADRLLKRHSRGGVVTVLEQIRSTMDGKGPFVVTFDPNAINAGDAVALRAAVVAPGAHAALEILANPIRRAVLRRAGLGPCSFSEAMSASGIDESPKLAFHMRKLVDDGLLVHHEDIYRITPRGKDAIHLLENLDMMVQSGGLSNAVAPSRKAA
jgi:ActR/RegA family two-component response regulator